MSSIGRYLHGDVCPSETPLQQYASAIDVVVLLHTNPWQTLWCLRAEALVKQAHTQADW